MLSTGSAFTHHRNGDRHRARANQSCMQDTAVRVFRMPPGGGSCHCQTHIVVSETSLGCVYSQDGAGITPRARFTPALLGMPGLPWDRRG